MKYHGFFLYIECRLNLDIHFWKKLPNGFDLKNETYTLSRGDDPKRYSQSYLDSKEEITGKKYI